MAIDLSLSVVISLVDRLSQGARAIGERLRGIGEGAGSAAERFGQLQQRLNATANMTFVAGALGQTGRGMVGALEGPARAAVDLESAMADVRKVVDFAAPDGLRHLTAQLQEMSTRIPLAATGLAQIAAAGGQLGIGEADLAPFVETVAKMATAFDLAPEVAGDAMAKLANVYQIPLAQIATVGDAINHLSNNSAAKASEMVAAMGRIGGAARQFGLSAVQAGALSNAFIALGKPPEVAATAINALLLKLQTADRQGGRFQEGLAAIGLDAQALTRAVGEDAQGALTGFLERLAAVPETARAGLVSDLFGLEYGDDIALLAGSLETYRKALGLVGDQATYAGSMQAEFAARADTTANGFQLLQNRLDGLKTSLGETLLPTLREASEALAGILGRVQAWAAEHPELVRGILLAAGALGALMAGGAALVSAGAGVLGTLALLKYALVGLGLSALRVGPLLGALWRGTQVLGFAATLGGRALAVGLLPALRQAGAAALAFGRALLASPITWVVAGLVGLAAAGYLVAKNWDALVAAAGNLWAQIKAMFARGAVFVLEQLQAVAQAMSWLVPDSAMERLNQALAGLKEMAEPTIAPVELRLPSLQEAMADMGLDALQERLGALQGPALAGALALGSVPAVAAPQALPLPGAAAVPGGVPALAVPAPAWEPVDPGGVPALAVPAPAWEPVDPGGGLRPEGAVATAPISITVNIQGAATREDADAIARRIRAEVERALEEREGRDAMARRARLWD